MKHEIYVKCEWKHQKLDDLMNYKFSYHIRNIHVHNKENADQK